MGRSTAGLITTLESTCPINRRLLISKTTASWFNRTDRYVFNPDEGVVMPKHGEGAPMAPGWQFDDIVPELTRQIRAADSRFWPSKTSRSFCSTR